MSELDLIIATFRTSEPVFKIFTDKDNSTMSFVVKTQYVPAETDDPVQSLLASYWSERVDMFKKGFVSVVYAEDAYYVMLKTIEEVVFRCSSLKNPKQSKLYKWLRVLPRNHHSPQADSFIALYRYIKNNNLDNYGDTISVHQKNVLAILELMREKYV